MNIKQIVLLRAASSLVIFCPPQEPESTSQLSSGNTLYPHTILAIGDDRLFISLSHYFFFFNVICFFLLCCCCCSSNSCPLSKYDPHFSGLGRCYLFFQSFTPPGFARSSLHFCLTSKMLFSSLTTLSMASLPLTSSSLSLLPILTAALIFSLTIPSKSQ